MKTLVPLMVHIVFHPRSEAGRTLARDIHLGLNNDAVVTGLRIPTSFCFEREDEAPPKLVLTDAERNVVVVLADAKMDSSAEWSAFAASLWEECQVTTNRCIPLQLGEHAWPLDSRLKEVSFFPAWTIGEHERTEVVCRRLVIEFCRYLNDDARDGDGRTAPTTVFVSHTKIDSANEPRVVQKILEALTVDSPVRAWFDSGDIAAGSVFSREIEAGIRDSSLLCVLTDNYASREWCRTEILLAKSRDRPIVVVDALSSFEARSFPYLGNLPVVRWGGDARQVLDCVLKETLRQLYVKCELDQLAGDSDEVFTRPPELLTISRLSERAHVLYPDPPLGHSELELLGHSGVVVSTPLERLGEGPSDLSGKKLAVSMSESSDIARFGYCDLHQSEVTLDLSRHLLIRGATLVFGGHLGDSGYTAALTELVRAHNDVAHIDPVNRIENYVGWPLPLDDETVSKYRESAKLVAVDRPDGLDQHLHPDFAQPNKVFFDADKSPLHRYAWARGMSATRGVTAGAPDICARIVLGGTFRETYKAQADGSTREKWYQGRIPGLLEEVLLSMEAGQPVFLLGAFGGIPALIMDTLDRKERVEMTWGYQSNAPGAREMREIYAQQGEKWWSYEEMAQYLAEKGLSGINPFLTPDEHRELFAARRLPDMIRLLLLGLNRIPDR